MASRPSAHTLRGPKLDLIRDTLFQGEGNVVSELNLTTAQYVNQAHEADDAATSRPAVGALERFTSRLSLLIGTALAIGVTLVAVGYLASVREHVSARAEKSTHPLDWLLWFGGAERDQTLEKYINDTTAKSKREWDEQYRKSPAYLEDPQGIDWKRVQWKHKFSPPLTNPARGAR